MLKKIIKVERFGLATPLALNERRLKSRNACFVFLEEPQSRAHHVACRGEAPASDLLLDKTSEMIA